MTTTETTEERLQSKALLQFAFKGDKVRQVATAVAMAFDNSPSGSVWVDEIELPPLDVEDRNIIGLVYKNMAKWGMIERLEGADSHRRSQRNGRRGGTIFKYRLTNRSLLKTFMLRNHAVPAGDPQQEFSL